MNKELYKAIEEMEYAVLSCSWSCSRESLELVGKAKEVIRHFGEPIDMILYCPKCHLQHIDASMTDAQYTERLHEPSWGECGGDKPERWINPPHRSHLCHNCGTIWRPADVATNGVAAIKTKGKGDTV